MNIFSRFLTNLLVVFHKHFKVLLDILVFADLLKLICIDIMLKLIVFVYRIELTDF